MAKNAKQTSKSVASKASKILRDNRLIIPALFEPPVRSMRATLPAQQSQTFR